MHSRAALAPVFLIASILTATPAAAAPTPVEPTYGQRTPEAARAAMNRAEAEKAREQLAANVSSQRSFEDAKAAREAQIAADQQMWEQEKARLTAQHEAAMEQWRADVEACRRHDWNRCKH